MSGWQPIETAPKDGTRILAFWARAATEGDPGITVIRWYDYGGLMAWYGATTDGIVLTGATHWMPLPEPPNSADSELQGAAK